MLPGRTILEALRYVYTGMQNVGGGFGEDLKQQSKKNVQFFFILYMPDSQS